jgi:hypothetical protein
MSLILDPGVEDRLVAIGAKNSLRAQREGLEFSRSSGGWRRK